MSFRSRVASTWSKVTGGSLCNSLATNIGNRSGIGNRTKLPENMQMFSDESPKQKQYLEYLKEELNRRTQDGEKNLTIRYVKGKKKQ